MSDRFYVTKKGGIHDTDAEFPGEGLLIAFEGTAEKGPWYNAWSFSDTQIERWLARGYIKFMEKKVE